MSFFGLAADGDRDGSGAPNVKAKLASYFGRVFQKK